MADTPQTDSWLAKIEAQLAEPAFLADPVLPADQCACAFGKIALTAVLERAGSNDLIPGIRVTHDGNGLCTLGVSGLGCWVIDLEYEYGNGLRGHDDFLARVRNPVRRPPDAMAHMAAEQHILSVGVHQVQIRRHDQESATPYEVCDLKTFGWYVAALKMPGDSRH